MIRSILKTILYIAIVANLKSWPFSWHARFFYVLFKHMVFKAGTKPKSLFKPNVFHTHTPLMEMDMNLHKSNSTYFSDLDIARSDLLISLFKDFFKHYRFQKGAWPFCPLGSVMTIFKREIFVYKPYVIKSRVLGWDNKWLFILSRFEFSNGTLAAAALSKYVFKFKRKTIPPEEAVKFIKLDTPENIQQGTMSYERAKTLQMEEIQDEPIYLENVQ